jgi:hypothetical protein
VLVIYVKNKPGALVVAHQDDLTSVAAELAGYNGPQPPRLGLRRCDGRFPQELE